MNRPRTSARSKGLPDNLYPTGINAYRYRNPLTGEVFPFGTDKRKAVSAAKKLNARLLPDNDLVGMVTGGSMLLSDYSKKWVEEIIPKHKPNLAAGTMHTYRSNINRINQIWGDFQLDKITTLDITKGFEGLTDAQIYLFRSRLTCMFDDAIADGYIEYNPAEKTRTVSYETKRQRMTMAQFKAIKKQAEPWMQNLMDLGLVFLQRVSDLLELRFDNICDNKLELIQKKTQKYDTGYLRITLTDEMNQAITRCRDNIPSPYIIHRIPKRKVKNKRGHWTKVEYDSVQVEFDRARDATGLFDDWADGTAPTFHETRALGIKRYRDKGLNPQQLAGHASEKQTDNYDSRHEDIRWVEVNL